MECWGAQGGTLQSWHVPGKGGYSTGNYTMSANTLLYVCVGNCGAYGTYSYNNNLGRNLNAGMPGGGATHISINSGGELKSFASHPNDVLIVAGGGGSCDMTSDVVTGVGGQGGGVNGTTGSNSGGGSLQNGNGTGASSSVGGTSIYDTSVAGTVNGSFGLGGVAWNTGNDYGAQGGSGYYGGGGCMTAGTSGGGSAYLCSLLKNGKTIGGNNNMPNPQGGSDVIGHSGNGFCIISWFLK